MERRMISSMFANSVLIHHFDEFLIMNSFQLEILTQLDLFKSISQQCMHSRKENSHFLFAVMPFPLFPAIFSIHIHVYMLYVFLSKLCFDCVFPCERIPYRNFHSDRNIEMFYQWNSIECFISVAFLLHLECTCSSTKKFIAFSSHK